MIAWLPMELQKYWQARLVLGVLVKEGRKVNAQYYRSQYREKVYELLKKERDPLWALELHLPERLSQAPNPKDLGALLEWLLEASGFQDHGRHFLSLYLQGRGNLESVLDALKLDESDQEDPPSQEEFQKELKDLDLALFLELAHYVPV